MYSSVAYTGAINLHIAPTLDVSGTAPLHALPVEQTPSPVQNQIKLDRLEQDSNYYLRCINQDIQGLSEYLESDPTLKAPRNTVFIRFDKLALDYHKCFQLNIARRTVPVEQLKDVLASTFFDSEAKARKAEGLRSSPPSSDMTLILLLQFLTEKQFRSKEEILLCKLIRSNIEVLSLLKITINYFQKYRDVMQKLLVEWIESKMKKLPVGETMGLPGGWVNLSSLGIGGHFMQYALKCVSNGQFEVARINSHSYSNSLSPCKTYEKAALPPKRISSFISNIVDFHIPVALTNRLQKIEEEHHLTFLYNMNRLTSPQTTPSISFPLQAKSFNCCFMAIFILFQTLHANSTKSPEEAASVGKEKALLLRSEFQTYLRSKISPN